MFFRKITIHDFMTILCHVGFTILQVVWAVRPNNFPYYKAFQGNKKKKKKNGRYLGRSGQKKGHYFIFLIKK